MAQTLCTIFRPADRERLTTIVSDRNRQRKHTERAQVIVASAEGGPVQQIAAQLGVSRPMVWRWQQRFAEEGVDGLLRDKTRKPGKPPIAAETVQRVMALTCSKPPGETTHWTGRAMVKDGWHLPALGAADLGSASAAAASGPHVQALA